MQESSQLPPARVRSITFIPDPMATSTMAVKKEPRLVVSFLHEKCLFFGCVSYRFTLGYIAGNPEFLVWHAYSQKSLRSLWTVNSGRSNYFTVELASRTMSDIDFVVIKIAVAGVFVIYHRCVSKMRRL